LGNTFICDRCGKEFNWLEAMQITLDGVDDFYTLNVCSHCYTILSDYFSPEDVDQMIKTWHKS
jgi:DNA-directed RNA polymerase subunit RPC12/RpoP